MKKIILITTIYPLPDSSNVGTPVCHYFTKEWAKSGHHITVIHIQAVYPFFFYWIARLSRNLIMAKTGAVVYIKRDREIIDYQMDNVHIYKVPVFKMIPYGKFSKKSIVALKKWIDTLISSVLDNDVDCVVGHFTNPILEVLSHVKRVHGARTAMTLHGSGIEMKSIYKNTYPKYFKDIDIWGYRSQSIKNKFEGFFGKTGKSFMCYSGIPQSYVVNQQREFKGVITKFVFLGSLYKLKNVSTILHALKQVYQNQKFEFRIIGDGAEYANLKKEVHALGIDDCVRFDGVLPREQAQKILQKSECFIMVSSPEAFGLVYLEAMASGCLTIGSKNEGIDGVIKHGENGFLCEPKDVLALSNLIVTLNNMSTSELQIISKKAIHTANQLTDSFVAKKYLDSVFS